jgi:hypothetical protein
MRLTNSPAQYSKLQSAIPMSDFDTYLAELDASNLTAEQLTASAAISAVKFLESIAQDMSAISEELSGILDALNNGACDESDDDWGGGHV